MPIVASLSETIKVFRLENGKFAQNDFTESMNHNFPYNSCMSWSGNGMWVTGGAANQKDGVPLFKYKNGLLKWMRTLKEPSASAASFFNLTNGKIAIGTAEGAVNIWDIKDNKVIKNLCEQDVEPVKRLAIATEDGHLAIGFSSKIKLYGLTTMNFLTSMDEPQKLSCLQFSPIRKNYLGACTLDSGVYFWDINKKDTLLSVKNAHVGACSGLSMSPINYHLAVSVAMTKTVKMHDLRSKKPALAITLNRHLTAVDMVLSEPILALGSIDGYLMSLDLRNSTIVEEFAAHSSQIVSVRTAPCANKKFVETMVSTPEIVPEEKPVEVSFSDIMSPFPLNKTTSILSPNPANLISPVEQIRREISHRISHSTPNNLNCSDSFLNLVRTPDLSSAINHSENGSVVAPKFIVNSENSLNNKTEVSKSSSDIDLTPIDNISTPFGQPSTPIEQPASLLRQMLDSLTTIKDQIGNLQTSVNNQLSTLQTSVTAINDLETKYESLVGQVKTNFELLLDIRQDIHQLPYQMRAQSYHIISSLDNQ